MTAGGVVLVVGDVMNDVVVRPDGPVASGTDTLSEIVHSPGGSGANQAAWLASLGVAVRFAGRAGAEDAHLHRAALERHGVEARIAEDPGRTTGTVVALVAPDGERSMCTDRGANAALEPSDLPASLLEGVGLLHVSGYLLFEPASRAAVGKLWAAAGVAGIPTSVDPASVAGLRGLGAGAFLAATAGAQLVFPNLDEGRFLASREDPAEVAAALAGTYAVVVLKLGARGALVAARGHESIHVDADPATVVDSTGAGDAFCAGFLACWLAGGDLAPCAAAAVGTAARAASGLGARPPG